MLLASVSVGQEVNIIPKPVEMRVGKGSFIIDDNTYILAYLDQHKAAANILNHFLKNFYGFALPVTSNPKKSTKLIVFSSIHAESGFPSEGYRLAVQNNKIEISSKGKGTFYGIQTLIQLFPVPPTNLKPQTSNYKLTIPELQITDYPRFEYRGMHLDCSRHFWPVDFVKQYIDYLALHKFNKFHWHLTDDQGWRIEIKKYPKLSTVGGWRNGTIIGRYPGTGNDGIKYGGYYTQEQIKEIVKYAADRYIDVIPEIEMPGHSSAAIAAYPELSCFPGEPTKQYFPKQCAWSGDSTGKQVQQTWGVFDDVFCAGQEKTFEFLKDVMDEVLGLFPSKYIHVGGDECPKENWKRCPYCQKRIKDNNLKDEHELQSYFIQRMEKYLNSKGRTLIGWDEILEGGLAPNAVVMSWRGEAGGIKAAKQKHHVIMTPGNPVYFDHSQSENEDSITIGGYNPVEKVYAYEPIPKELNEEEGKYVLGAQANMWTEYMKNTKKVEYMLFPRMAALSEVLWSPKENRNWDDFQKRFIPILFRYKLWGVNYSPAFFELNTSVIPSSDFNGVIWKISAKSKGEIRVAEEVFPKTKQVAHDSSPDGELIQKSCTMIASFHPEYNDYTTVMLKQNFYFSKATGKKITLTTSPSNKYPGDGAFTLVNGVINEKGMGKNKEFLGFNGNDCEVIIDLIKPETINKLLVHGLHQESSWIWRPQAAEAFALNEKDEWQSLGLTDDFVGKPNGIMTISCQPVKTQQVKVVIKNWGEIPAGNPGAGNKAWLFVDEIEIN